MEDEEEEEDEIDKIQPITRRKDQPGNLTQSKHKPNTPFFRILSYYVYRGGKNLKPYFFTLML